MGVARPLRVARSRHTVARLLRACLLTACLGLPVALAGTCRTELDAALAASSDPHVVTGLDAVRALERAVTLVEPAMPPLVLLAELPVPDDHPEAARVRFVAERALLPPGWSPEALTPGVWRSMLGGLLAWYGLEPRAPPAVPTDDAQLAADVADALDRIADAIRPAALLATASEAGQDLAFLALIWNWTAYPRLLVFPPNAASGGGPVDRATAIAALENCVRTIRHWFSAPEDTARGLFLANRRGRMVVVGGEPAGADAWPWWVPPGDEVAVFTFDHPRVAGLEAFAAVFDAPPLGVARLVRLLPRIRTNASPIDLPGYLQTPPGPR